MKTSWQTKKLDDVIDRVVYTKKIHRKRFLPSGKFPIVSQEKDYINGYWDNEKDIFKVRKPVILFGDHTQVLKYVDFDFVLGADGVKILQPKAILDSKYFYYSLKNVNLKNLGYARHSKLLKKADISYPESLDEQKRIVKILDEVFGEMKRAKGITEKNLQNSKELFESFTNRVITENNSKINSVNLGELIEVLTDFVANGSFASLKQNVKYLKNEGYAVLVRLTDLRNNLKTNTGVFVSESAYKFLKKSSLHGGEYLIANVGANIGDVIQMPKINRPATLGPNMFLVKFKKEINSDFILAISKYFIKPAIVKVSQGSAQPKINKSQFRNIKVPYPSVSEQKSIVKKLDTLSAETEMLEEIYRQKLDDLEELKKSVLRKAFNAEL